MYRCSGHYAEYRLPVAVGNQMLAVHCDSMEVKWGWANPGYFGGIDRWGQAG